MKNEFNDPQALRMLKITQTLLYVNALVWLMFAVLGSFRAITGAGALRWILSGLMLINATAMFWFGLKIISGNARIFFFAILYMALNVVLSITDQFGWNDFSILLLNLIILGLLFVTRQRMLRVSR